MQIKVFMKTIFKLNRKINLNLDLHLVKICPNSFPFDPNNRVARLIVIGVLRIVSEIGAPWGQLAHLANRKVAAVNTRCCALETMVVNMHVRQFPPSLKQSALRGLLNFLRLS